MTMTSTRTKPTYEQFSAIRRYQPVLAFSPDGEHIAYSVNISGQYNLWRQPSAGGYPVQLTLSSSQSVREIDWSPDGESIVYTADNDGDEFTRKLQRGREDHLADVFPLHRDGNDLALGKALLAHHDGVLVVTRDRAY